MPITTAKQAMILLERYRADLEDINRRIRIVEWLAKGQQRKTAKQASC